MSLSKNLKELRIESGLSQAQLAEKTGLSQSAIARWELGKTEPTASAIELLADFFNISTEILLQGDSAILPSEPPEIVAPLPSNRIKLLRKSRNLTQAQVADAVELGRQAYAYYEKGERAPSPETLCKLADFFGVSVDELLGRTPQLFDDARIQKSDEQVLFDELTAEEKQMVVGYMKGLIFNRTKGRKAQ